MYKLGKVYSKSSYDAWKKNPEIGDLRDTKTETKRIESYEWEIKTYRELKECVAFLGQMNKRISLFFRGQGNGNYTPSPTLFRPDYFFKNDWLFKEESRNYFEKHPDNYACWNTLQTIGSIVYELVKELGLPRWRGLKETREEQWAIIQHYQLWPTPLLDLTSSLQIAVSFALNHGQRKEGYLYVAGMPRQTGSTTFSIDDQLSLSSLQSICPPTALRPHYQEAYLVGRFPFYPMNAEDLESLKNKSKLRTRIVAKFKLIDEGDFWPEDSWAILPKNVLYPDTIDQLLVRFREEKFKDKLKSHIRS